MQFFTGSPALSSSRLERLLNEIRGRVPAVTCIASHFIHFADLVDELDEQQTDHSCSSC